jgi:hypothetical protein
MGGVSFSWRKRRARPTRRQGLWTISSSRGLNPGDEDETELLTLDATPLIYALVNAVKELSARVAALEGKIGETKPA